MNKKVLAALLSVVMLLSLLCGCGSGTTANETASTEVAEEESTGKTVEKTTLQKLEIPDASSLTLSVNQSKSDMLLSALGEGSGAVNASTSLVSGQTSLDGAAYVMIYNPLIYDEEMEPVTTANMSTGSISDQIDIATNRAGGMDINVSSVTMSQSDLTALGGDIETQRGGRAAGLTTVYQTGDVEEFFYFSSLDLNIRAKGSFTCVYAGEHCNIWSLEGSAVSVDDAQMIGVEFDTNIYQQDIEEFGVPRFADEGGKVNMLFYPMGVNDNGSYTAGFFYTPDLYASGEVSSLVAEANMVNTDCEILNINSTPIDLGYGDLTTILSTISHEFQHMIAATDYLDNAFVPMMGTWLNEAMSAYAEDYIYPGIKEQNSYNVLFYLSDNYRYGQSLYNFSCNNDPNIGAYGTVYLFENYLRDLAGDTTFSAIHTAWRGSTSAYYTEGDAIAESVSAYVKDEIDTSVTYPDSVIAEIGSDNDVWLSKLTLNFYLNTLSSELGNLGAYTIDVRDYMVYDQLQSADIEGGGRIVVATKDGSFNIPTDADGGLVYIGLDENFNVITDAICTEYGQAGSPVETASAPEDTADEYDTTGDYFVWNGWLDSAILVPTVHDSLVNNMISTLDEDYQIAGINPSDIDQSCSTAAAMASALYDYSGYGFVTIIVPDGTSYSDYLALGDAMLDLMMGGTIVTIITDTDADMLYGYVVALDYSLTGDTLADLCSSDEFIDTICCHITNDIASAANEETEYCQIIKVS